MQKADKYCQSASATGQNNIKRMETHSEWGFLPCTIRGLLPASCFVSSVLVNPCIVSLAVKPLSLVPPLRLPGLIPR